MLLWMILGNGWTVPGQVATSNSVASPATATPETGATARWNETLIELRTRSALFQSLSEEHLKKAEQALGLSQGEKARWEQELATDLQARNAQVTKQLTDLKLQLSKSDEDHGPAATPTGGAEKAEGLESDALIYLARLNEILSANEREIAAAMEQAQSYVLQLQTNNTPEQVKSVSISLEENKHALQELRKQQSDLELRKLEFWANRRRP